MLMGSISKAPTPVQPDPDISDSSIKTNYISSTLMM